MMQRFLILLVAMAGSPVSRAQLPDLFSQLNDPHQADNGVSTPSTSPTISGNIVENTLQHTAVTSIDTTTNTPDDTATTTNDLTTLDLPIVTKHSDDGSSWVSYSNARPKLRPSKSSKRDKLSKKSKHAKRSKHEDSPDRTKTFPTTSPTESPQPSRSPPPSTSPHPTTTPHTPTLSQSVQQIPTPAPIALLIQDGNNIFGQDLSEEAPAPALSPAAYDTPTSESLRVITLSDYSICYLGMEGQTPHDDEINEVVLWTEVYLEQYFQRELVQLDTLETSNLGYNADKGCLNFRSAAMFAYGNFFVPTKEQLDKLLATALVTYMDAFRGVNGILDDNSFHQSTQISFGEPVPKTPRLSGQASNTDTIVETSASEGNATKYSLLAGAGALVLVAGALLIRSKLRDRREKANNLDGKQEVAEMSLAGDTYDETYYTRSVMDETPSIMEPGDHTLSTHYEQENESTNSSCQTPKAKAESNEIRFEDMDLADAPELGLFENAFDAVSVASSSHSVYDAEDDIHTDAVSIVSIENGELVVETGGAQFDEDDLSDARRPPGTASYHKPDEIHYQHSQSAFISLTKQNEKEEKPSTWSNLQSSIGNLTAFASGQSFSNSKTSSGDDHHNKSPGSWYKRSESTTQHQPVPWYMRPPTTNSEDPDHQVEETYEDEEAPIREIQSSPSFVSSIGDDTTTADQRVQKARAIWESLEAIQPVKSFSTNERKVVKPPKIIIQSRSCNTSATTRISSAGTHSSTCDEEQSNILTNPQSPCNDLNDSTILDRMASVPYSWKSRKKTCQISNETPVPCPSQSLSSKMSAFSESTKSTRPTVSSSPSRMQNRSSQEKPSNKDSDESNDGMGSTATSMSVSDLIKRFT